MFAGIKILIIGVIVVVAVLCLLWASCSIMGFAFRTVEARQKAAAARREAKAAAEAQTIRQPPAPASPAAPGVPPHHLAVIAAATAAALDRPHRIVRVWAPVPMASDWTNQARLQTFNSHRRQGDWGRAVQALTSAPTQS